MTTNNVGGISEFMWGALSEHGPLVELSEDIARRSAWTRGRNPETGIHYITEYALPFADVVLDGCNNNEQDLRDVAVKVIEAARIT